MKCAEHVIYGLDEAVMTMHEGEVASFTIPPQHAFGVAGSNQYQLAVVPPNSVVIYEMELLSIVDAV
jgi:FK506-binding protein 4/5